MRLLIKQRVFSWGDKYDVYDENGEARYFVKSDLLALGHHIHVYRKDTGEEVGAIHQRLLTLLSKFDIEIGGAEVGCVSQALTFLRPRYEVDYRGWDVEGDFFEWDYQVKQGDSVVMTIQKELLHWGDTYVLEYRNPAFELPGLLLVLAIDAANCDH